MMTIKTYKNNSGMFTSPDSHFDYFTMKSSYNIGGTLNFDSKSFTSNYNEARAIWYANQKSTRSESAKFDKSSIWKNGLAKEKIHHQGGGKMKRIAIKSLLFLLIIIATGCFTTNRDSFDARFLQLIDKVIENPNKIINFSYYFPEYKCNFCNYDFSRDTIKIKKLISQIEFDKNSNEDFYFKEVGLTQDVKDYYFKNYIRNNQVQEPKIKFKTITIFKKNSNDTFDFIFVEFDENIYLLKIGLGSFVNQ